MPPTLKRSLTVASFAFLVVAWGATAALMWRDRQSLAGELRSVRQTNRSGAITTTGVAGDWSRGIDCARIEYKELQDVGGSPGIVLVSCVQLTITDSGAEALLQVGNPFNVTYHSLSVRASALENPLELFRLEGPSAVLELEAGAWSTVRVPVLLGKPTSTKLSGERILVRIEVPEATLPKPSVPAAAPVAER